MRRAMVMGVMICGFVVAVCGVVGVALADRSGLAGLRGQVPIEVRWTGAPWAVPTEAELATVEVEINKGLRPGLRELVDAAWAAFLEIGISPVEADRFARWAGTLAANYDGAIDVDGEDYLAAWRVMLLRGVDPRTAPMHAVYAAKLRG